MSYSPFLNDHRSMVFDSVRNAVYFRAIASAVTPASRVLDLGAGVGVLGLEAARLGAQKVYLVDPSSAVRAAAAIAADNGLQERVEIIQAPVESIALDAKVDVILSVFTGNFLLEEDLLPLLFQARDRFLAPGGAMIPDRASMFLAPVSLPEYYASRIGCWGPAEDGIDYSAGREYAVNSAYCDSAKKFAAQFLGAVVPVAELDFTTATSATCKVTLNLSFNAAGTCHGFLGWFDMRLGQEWLSTSPLATATHWSQMFFPFRTPLVVNPGDSATLRLLRPQNGQWSWIVEFGAQRQIHSTAMASPLARSDFTMGVDSGLGSAGLGSE